MSRRIRPELDLSSRGSVEDALSQRLRRSAGWQRGLFSLAAAATFVACTQLPHVNATDEAAFGAATAATTALVRERKGARRKCSMLVDGYAVAVSPKTAGSDGNAAVQSTAEERPGVVDHLRSARASLHTLAASALTGCAAAGLLGETVSRSGWSMWTAVELAVAGTVALDQMDNPAGPDAVRYGQRLDAATPVPPQSPPPAQGTQS